MSVICLHIFCEGTKKLNAMIAISMRFQNQPPKSDDTPHEETNYTKVQ